MAGPSTGPRVPEVVDAGVEVQFDAKGEVGAAQAREIVARIVAALVGSRIPARVANLSAFDGLIPYDP